MCVCGVYVAVYTEVDKEYRPRSISLEPVFRGTSVPPTLYPLTYLLFLIVVLDLYAMPVYRE